MCLPRTGGSQKEYRMGDGLVQGLQGRDNRQLLSLVKRLVLAATYRGSMRYLND
jgi:hypothetical protein